MIKYFCSFMMSHVYMDSNPPWQNEGNIKTKRIPFVPLLILVIAVNEEARK